MKTNHYVRSWAYETFVNLARNTSSMGHNANNGEMQSLMLHEEDSPATAHLNRKKLLSKIIREMNQAMKVALSRKFDQKSKFQLKELADKIDLSETSDQLLAICDSAKEILRPFRTP